MLQNLQTNQDTFGHDITPLTSYGFVFSTTSGSVSTVNFVMTEVYF